MWLLFSIASVVVWGVALGAGYPFRWWIVAVAVSAILAALFFLPGSDGWGFRVPRSAWCQLGTCTAVAYLLLCAFAHHSAILRVRNFATANHIDAVRMGALPVPPSLLDWGDAIRTPEGVYQARFDLRHAENPSFYFLLILHRILSSPAPCGFPVQLYC